MKIALIQHNPVIGDFAGNLAAICRWLQKARERGCDLAVLPELALSGYPPQDLLERKTFLDDQDRAFARLLTETADIGVLCGLISRHSDGAGKPLHNSAALCADGRVLFRTEKRLLPCYDVFDESRWFEPGRHSRVCRFKGLRLGITICEDIWNSGEVFARPLYAVDPVAELLAQADGPVDLLLNIAASPFSMGKSALRQKLFAGICRRHGLPLVYVNQVGGQDSLIFDGNSMALTREGNVAARAAAFSEDMVVLDTASWQGEDHAPPAGQGQEIAGVLQALVLGCRDYVRKCGFSRVVVGLSGGVDSALTAAIASQALGAANVLGVALPSPYSSPASLEDARQLAGSLGLEFTVLPITPIFATFLAALGPVFAGAAPGLAEQNIQARIRGALLMALANKQNRMLLSTGNKSESAVGYCTLYGDMSGGLAVLADVPKQMVYALCRHINQGGEIIPDRTMTRPPSAELAPDQKDEDDLPPYPVLDRILTAYLEERLSVPEIAAMGFARSVVEDVVRRIHANEHKRKQAPPGLKVTDKAFGHGRRYPTAHGYRENPLP